LFSITSFEQSGNQPWTVSLHKTQDRHLILSVLWILTVRRRRVISGQHDLILSGSM
jgi:hypothetical protein